MIAKKNLPGLQWPALPRHDVDRNRGLRDTDAQFEQLTVDLGSAPQRVPDLILYFSETPRTLPDSFVSRHTQPGNESGWLSSFSSQPDHKPGPSRDKARACYPGDQAAKWHDLFNEHEGRDRGDPQHVHNAAYEQKRHQCPTAANAISAMT